MNRPFCRRSRAPMAALAGSESAVALGLDAPSAWKRSTAQLNVEWWSRRPELVHILVSAGGWPLAFRLRYRVWADFTPYDAWDPGGHGTSPSNRRTTQATRAG